MSIRTFLLACLMVGGGQQAMGQAPPPTSPPAGGWRGTAETTAPSPAATASQPAPSKSSPGQTAPPKRVAAVSTGTGTLPHEQGQIWREYDISPYTLRVASTNRPEQAIVDWVLRETGYEAWHSEPLAILSASRRTLRVYHTPEMQDVVADIVDRFVSSEAQTHTFSLRVITVNSPDWRSRCVRLLQPVPVQTPGVQAWLLEKETAAAIVADLRRRSDFREHSSPYLIVNNGQSTVVSTTRGRSYVRDAILQPTSWPGFQPETAVVDEGFSLEFSPLLSVDGKTIDGIIKCEINQVEKMVPVMLDVPTAVAPRQRTRIEVPQMAHFQFHERFRWPSDKVLLVGMGMVPLPVPGDGMTLIGGIPLPLRSAPARAELLVFVDGKGQLAARPAGVSTASRAGSANYRGRY